MLHLFTNTHNVVCHLKLVASMIIQCSDWNTIRWIYIFRYQTIVVHNIWFENSELAPLVQGSMVVEILALITDKHREPEEQDGPKGMYIP